jgi:hypothetical protein
MRQRKTAHRRPVILRLTVILVGMVTLLSVFTFYPFFPLSLFHGFPVVVLGAVVLPLVIEV